MGGKPKVERGQWVTMPVGARVYGHGVVRVKGRGFALQPFEGGAIVALGPPSDMPALIVDVHDETETHPRLVFARMSSGGVLAICARDVRALKR